MLPSLSANTMGMSMMLDRSTLAEEGLPPVAEAGLLSCSIVIPLAFLKTVYFCVPPGEDDVDEPDAAAVVNCVVCPVGVFRVKICWPPEEDEPGRVFTMLPMLVVEVVVPVPGLFRA